MARASIHDQRRLKKLTDYENSQLEIIGWQCHCGCGRRVGQYPRTDFHWDHVDPRTKIDTISNMRRSLVKLPKFVAEIAKCQFLYVKCHQALKRRQNAGEIVDYRLPKLHRDWDMLPINDTGSARLNSLSDFKDPRGVEMYDHWIKLYPETIEWRFEEWCRQPVNRIMIEGVWVVTRDINGKLVSGHRISDGAEVEIHWRDGVRLRQTQQVH